MRLIQFLVIDLAQEEGIPLLSADAEYPIWTPLNAFDASGHAVADVANASGRTMTTLVRFAYADAAAGRTDGSRLAYLPITLRQATQVLAVVGLLDTGSTVQATLTTCAATYAYHLTQAHAFLDGNKRVAAAVAEIFLELNGAELQTTDEQIVALFLAIAAGQVSARTSSSSSRSGSSSNRNRLPRCRMSFPAREVGHPQPNQPLERTAHAAGFFGFVGIVVGGPPLTGGIRRYKLGLEHDRRQGRRPETDTGGLRVIWPSDVPTSMR